MAEEFKKEKGPVIRLIPEGIIPGIAAKSAEKAKVSLEGILATAHVGLVRVGDLTVFTYDATKGQRVPGFIERSKAEPGEPNRMIL